MFYTNCGSCPTATHLASWARPSSLSWWNVSHNALHVVLDKHSSKIYFFFFPILFYLTVFFLWFFVIISLAGDYGFDPLGLGEDPESLKWYVQAELVHARFAMLGVAGILFTDVSSSFVHLVFQFCSFFKCQVLYFISVLFALLL